MNSLKKHFIMGYALTNNIEQLEHNKLIVLTATGIITGTLVDSKDDKNDPSLQVPISINEGILKTYPEESAEGNDGFFALKNVTVFNGGNQMHFQFLNVFFDQIIGVTIGEF